jgi:penicillin amidase
LIYFIQETTDYLPVLNLIYSTKDDHIGYQAVGVVPIRRNPHSGMYVKDGSLSDHDWVGFIQGKDKLHIEDPERGYIISANNKAAPTKYFNGILDTMMYTARADRV